MEFVLRPRPITAEWFRERTGFDPQDDDLERCNCKHAGAIGHLFCGWNDALNKPQFMCEPLQWNGKPMPLLTAND